MEFLKDQYRHGKTILAMGDSKSLLVSAAILPLAGKDPGILLAAADDAAKAATAFVAAVSVHRHTGRDSDPPRV